MYFATGYRLLRGIFILSFTSCAIGSPADEACSLLKTALPGRVAGPLSLQYVQDNTHWTNSSSELSKCTIEPASSVEVAAIFQVINQTRTPWAVKGGGHAYNLGFSSTEGVQIAMSKFKEVTYDPSTSTAKIGAGNIWDDVYATLNPQGVNVVGGRISGVGVAGFTLGGGYSWSTEQHGLTIDTVVKYDLVTPTGKILDVTETSHPDLFFGLRGGGNNFGIVTAFTLRTHPQSKIFGGSITYDEDQLSATTKAIIDFSANNMDPKAEMIFSYTFIPPTLVIVADLFYDGPTPPNGTFDALLNIPALSNTAKTQAFSDFVQSLVVPDLSRFAPHTIPVIQYTKPIVDEIIKQTFALGKEIATAGVSSSVDFSLEPFTRKLYDHSKGGAYPHSPAHPWTPLAVNVGYDSPENDTSVRALVQKAQDAIHQVAIKEGQSSPDAILYNNYSPSGTDLKLLYGENLPILRRIRSQNDPHDLLNLTGGWHF